jgi:Uma2 family endonuclease
MSTSSYLPTTMTFPVSVLPKTWKLDDLQAHLGGIPLSRIRTFPPPGMATEEDAFAIRREEGVLCEVVDGVLVEKTVGWLESAVAAYLCYFLHEYLKDNPLGIVLGSDGPVRVVPRRQMRLPDVSFIRYDRLPTEAYEQKVCPTTPDLIAEVLSENNTVGEIDRKLDECFEGGTQLAWIIDPDERKATIYTSRHEYSEIDDTGMLEGGKVLPGFSVSLAKLLTCGRADRV